MQFEWDQAKAADNVAKHGVSFEEAATALRDPRSTTGLDPNHSVDEERFITFGISTRGRLLVRQRLRREFRRRGSAYPTNSMYPCPATGRSPAVPVTATAPSQ